MSLPNYAGTVASDRLANDRLLTLDAMRGGAAFAVLAMHLSPTLVPSGYLAVDFFFLLSGLVIARAYGGRIAAGMRLRDFVAARVIRLYPLALLGATAGLLVRLFRHFEGMTPGALAWGAGFNLLLLPSPVTPNYVFPLNAPAWSLFFEVVINVVFAVVMVGSSQRRLGACLAVAAAALVGVAWVDGNLEAGAYWSNFTGGFVRTVFSFTAGVLIARRHPGPRRAGGLSPMLLGVLVAALLAAPAGRLRTGFDLAFVFTLAPALLWLGATWQPPRALRAAAAWLGDISYPLYALHFPLIWFFEGMAHRELLPAGAWRPACAAVAILLAWAANRVWDGPVRARLTAWQRRRIDARQPTAAQVPALMAPTRIAAASAMPAPHGPPRSLPLQ